MFDSLLCCTFHSHLPIASIFYNVGFVNNRPALAFVRCMLFIHYAMSFSANILFKFNGNDTHEAIALIAHDDERAKTTKATQRQIEMEKEKRGGRESCSVDVLPAAANKISNQLHIWFLLRMNCIQSLSFVDRILWKIL